MHRFVFACLVLALVAQVGWAEGENAQCGTASGSDADYTITPCNLKNNEVFNLVVIGDSIAWGNGLNRKNKYSYLVAYWLQEKLNRPVEVTVYAHSGAAIAGESGKSIDPNLNSESPTLMDQARNIQNKDDVDLILVSGGINDVGIQNIMDANTPAEDIERLSASIGDDMTNLLTYLLDETDAKIIVTGYYPIITEESKVEIQDRGVAGLLALTSEKTISQSENVLISAISDPTTAKVEAAWYLLDGTYNNAINLLTQDAKLRANSDTFYSTSSNSLDKVVKDADKGQNRIKFIDPLFERKNSYRAGSSFLWELNSDLKTNDFQYQERADLVEKTYPLDLNPLDQIKRAENKINPIAHPNRKGAAKYADTIKAVIDGEGLSWLDNSYPTIQSFLVTPQSLILGESFTIDYAVSDTSVSGLKQVELWRKDVTSDWLQINTNSLADETGPLSGTFTDSPAAPGKYWYGVHVVDNDGNWNDQKNSNTNGQPSNFEPAEVEVVVSPPPVVQAFQVTPQSLTLGESFAIDYTVSDNSGSGLKQVELWRKDETSDWREIKPPNTLAGENGPTSGSFTDSSSTLGKYWYGVHVVDNAGNWNDERNSNTNGQPSSFEPVEVEVKSSQEVTLNLYVHDGSADGPLLSGVEVTGQDAAGSSFSHSTDENGFEVITGSPGSWQFTATKDGYAVNSWSQEIIKTDTKHAFLLEVKPPEYARTNEFADESIAACDPGAISANCSSPDACVDCSGKCHSSGSNIGDGWVCNQGLWSNVLSSIVRNPNNGHYYKLVAQNLNWNDAKAYAESQQLVDPELGDIYKGHLATVTSLEENSWIMENMISSLSGQSKTWLGGYQDESQKGETSGDWHWVTDEPWSWANWNPGEPNDDNRDERYLELWGHADGHWNDEDVYHPNTKYLLVEYEM